TGLLLLFFFSSRRRHTRWPRDWSSDVCSSDLFVDGVDGRAGVRIGGKQGALGERMKFHGFGEKADAVHLRHALVGKKEGDRIVEIGRASCRERVEIWVGAGALK